MTGTAQVWRQFGDGPLSRITSNGSTSCSWSSCCYLLTTVPGLLPLLLLDRDPRQPATGRGLFTPAGRPGDLRQGPRPCATSAST